MARVDSGHETVTSEEEEDSPTPRHSPLITMPSASVVITDPEHTQPSPPSSINSGYSSTTSHNTTNSNNNSNDNCSQCKFTSRRFPITCENDLFRLASCTHKNSSSSYNTPSSQQSMMINNNTNNRSSSAVVCGDYSRRDQEFMVDSTRRPPPKLTGVINSCTKSIIRPIAVRHTDHYYCPGVISINTGSMKQSLERRNSEHFFEKRKNAEEMRFPSELSIPSNHHHNNNQLNSQRFGGSLCNVLPYNNNNRNKNGSTLHIEDVGITPLAKKNELNSSMQPFDHHEYEMGFSWEAERAMYESHLRAAHQRVIKLEQTLTVHCQQLEEAEWALCLLKAQLKDCQGDQVTKSHEVVQIRSHVKNLSAEVSSLRALLSQSNYNHKSVERENTSLKQKIMSQEKIQRDLNEENEILRKKLADMELKISFDTTLWEKERTKWREQTENWREEQDRVLRYQKALQQNYIKLQNYVKQKSNRGPTAM